MMEADLGEAIVEIRDLGVEIEDQVLLHPTTLTVRRGEAVALTGPNGSGKTTLLRVVAGILPPSSGEIRVLGRSPNEKGGRYRAAIAALIGLPPFARNLTLQEQLVLIAVSWGESHAGARDHADRMLEEFRIGHLVRRFPHELSSGQRQLYALCVALIRPAELLLLDEPEQRLDVEHRALLASALRQRLDAGTTVLMATHSAELVSASGARGFGRDVDEHGTAPEDGSE